MSNRPGRVSRATSAARLRWWEESAGLAAVAMVVIGVASILLRSAPANVPTAGAARTPVAVAAVAGPPAPPAPSLVVVGPAAFREVSVRPPTRADVIELVLATARGYLGTPYRYGATGPAAFDCSGFTSFVWRVAGVDLPHNSGAQFASLPKVPLTALMPGDLVFSGDGSIGHVGIYIGGGQMIHAPHTGRSVEISPLRTNLIGAARPLP